MWDTKAPLISGYDVDQMLNGYERGAARGQRRYPVRHRSPRKVTMILVRRTSRGRHPIARGVMLSGRLVPQCDISVGTVIFAFSISW